MLPEPAEPGGGSGAGGRPDRPADAMLCCSTSFSAVFNELCRALQVRSMGTQAPPSPRERGRDTAAGSVARCENSSCPPARLARSLRSCWVCGVLFGWFCWLVVFGLVWFGSGSSAPWFPASVSLPRDVGRGSVTGGHSSVYCGCSGFAAF